MPVYSIIKGSQNNNKINLYNVASPSKVPVLTANTANCELKDQKPFIYNFQEGAEGLKCGNILP